MELTAGQLLIISAVATVVSAILRLVVAKFGGVEIGKGWMSILAYVVSVLLAVGFLWPLDLPVGGDPSQFVGALVALAGSVFGFATIIYNVLLDKLLDAVGLKVEELAAG
jgi:nitrate/nitrite transporter NarK